MLNLKYWIGTAADKNRNLVAGWKKLCHFFNARDSLEQGNSLNPWAFLACHTHLKLMARLLLRFVEAGTLKRKDPKCASETQLAKKPADLYFSSYHVV